jgi:5-methylcytosine-specific restriction endonuclease McrA
MKNWRNSREYRIWRVRVIRRDKVCVVCGSRKHRQAHHLNSARYFKEQRFDIDNGVTLCRTCHLYMFHILFKGGYRKKTTKEDFAKFLQLVEHYKI